MRSLQDHVIQSFIETYKGNVMSIDAVLERIGANVHLTYSDGDIHTDYQSHSTPPTDGMITPDVVEEGGPQPFQKTEPIKKLSKLNKSFSVESHLPSSKADPSIKLNHREYLSRGAGFRSPNQKSHHPLQISAYIQSPMIQNTNPSVEEGAIINQLQQGYSTPPAPQSYGMEDSLTLDSLSLPYSLPPQHPNPHNRSLKPKISSQKSSSNSSSKWVLNQDSEPAPVPRKDQQQEKKKRQGPSTPSSSTSAGMASRPISTTNYGGGLYAISSYKNVLDKDYLENL